MIYDTTLGNNILGKRDFKIQNELIGMILWEGSEVCRYSWPSMVSGSHIHRFNQPLITNYNNKKYSERFKKQNCNSLHSIKRMYVYI